MKVYNILLLLNIFIIYMKSSNHKVNIIYFIWINKDRNYNIIINGQINDILISNIFEVAKLFIVIISLMY